MFQAVLSGDDFNLFMRRLRITNCISVIRRSPSVDHLIISITNRAEVTRR